MADTLPEDWSHWRREVDLSTYDDRWAALAAAGQDPHGEVALVLGCAVNGAAPTSVLDGGCGTGRVAVELARRGVTVLGVDPDPDMIAAATAKAPELRWVCAGLQDLDLPDRFDVVVLAGNVVPYAAAGDRAGVVAACARHLVPGGLLVAGFQLMAGWPTLPDYDAWCTAAGLELADRWATWAREPYAGGPYAVSAHRVAPTA